MRRKVPQVMRPRQPTSTRTSSTIWPVRENSAAMSTTVRPVTQTAEQAVKSETTGSPQAPSARENGAASATAPTKISARKPSATETRPFTA